MIKIYKYNEWTFKLGKCDCFDYDENIYIDLHNNPLTGFLENFKYYSEGDLRNYQYVENGKRSFKYNFEEFYNNFLKNQVDLDIEFKNILDKEFWNLI